MAAPAAQRVVELAQQLMSSYGSRPLVADGWWGRTTDGVYKSLGSEEKSVIDSFLSSKGFTASQLKMETDYRRISEPQAKTQVQRVRQNMLSEQSEVMAIIRGVAEEEGVPAKTMLAIARLESNFNPKAVSPTNAKGLFQFTRIAIKDVAQRGKPSFNLKGNEFDAKSNAIAGARYIKIVARDMNVPLTDAAAIYMGFNIGPSGARKYLSGNVDRSVAALINVQAYGPPSVYGKNLKASVDKYTTQYA